MNNSHATAANIRAEMARQKISGRRLAERMGESVMWVQRRTSGTGPITLDDLAKFATALGTTSKALLADEQVAS